MITLPTASTALMLIDLQKGIVARPVIQRSASVTAGSAR